MLSTWVVLPENKEKSVQKLYVYDFSIEKCKTESGREEILAQMSEKNWISERSIKDLKRAFKYLAKRRLNNDN